MLAHLFVPHRFRWSTHKFLSKPSKKSQGFFCFFSLFNFQGPGPSQEGRLVSYHTLARLSTPFFRADLFPVPATLSPERSIILSNSLPFCQLLFPHLSPLSLHPSARLARGNKAGARF